MKIRLTIAAAAMALIGDAGLAPPSHAQACNPLAVGNLCLNRGVPRINRITPGVGGDVVCERYNNPNQVQYDAYYFAWGTRFYNCTRFVHCNTAKTSDPQAWNRFCK